ncbi:hypothetical protein BKA65DRAFT_189122 [Rhexocercosporidium sp. MPI-PUGE-AT-0058]|nr:hypothetical protein BKA65DRAFT_189122 [Rhexocercosporidium sp. MPI-PUGE-AT-0058]
MSAIPSRTRSLRKPSESGSRYDRSHTSDAPETSAARPERKSQSPSRLPVKPPTRSGRSISTTSRPPSATGSISSNASMRPPPPRANVSKPTSTGGLQRSTSNRRANPPAAPEPEPVKKDRSRPPIVTSRHLRNASTSSFSGNSANPTTNVSSHTRTRSSSTLLNSATTLQPSKRSSVEIPKLQPLGADPQLRKQAFSTYQQHFSPAKNLAPKPHPAAFLAPPSPSKLPSNIAISAETAKLQNELLQLHLLHRDAAQVEKEWKASAKRKLGTRFHSIVDKNEELVQLEVEETGRINALALKKWQDMGTPGWGLDEKIQVLDEVVTGVWNLGESGGKYSRVVRKFERWFRYCKDILEMRANDEGLDGGDEVVFVEELDRGWKDDCLVLGRKLETWRVQLRELGVPDDHGSSLSVVVNGTRGLVKGMLAELNAMAQIERDAMRMEVEWIKGMNDDVLDNDTDTPPGAIWRSR